MRIVQEQKKKELEELNAMLAEMGVAPKESDTGTEGTAPSGKKKKKKEKAAVRESSAATVNGNGVAPAEQPKAEEPSSEQPQQESIEVLIANASCTSACTWDRLSCFFFYISSHLSHCKHSQPRVRHLLFKHRKPCLSVLWLSLLFQRSASV